MEVFEKADAFAGENFMVVNIPEDVKVIEDGALCGLKNVKEVVIPEGVEEIGSWAFYGCISLDNVKLSRNVRRIGENAFLDTAFYNDEKNWQDGVLYLKENLIRAQKNTDGTYFIKDGTRAISQGAFKNCVLLERVLILDSVEEIGAEVFVGCENLKAIYGGVNTAAEKYAGENGIKFIAVEYN